MERSVIEGEEWRPVSGRFEGAPYEVSSLGRVWSVPRHVEGSTNNRRAGGRVLATRLAWDGYVVVSLRHKQASKMVMVHKLVSDAFMGVCPRGLQVNHKDGDKQNSEVSNLEFVTPKQNIRHANETGLRKNNGWARGEMSGSKSPRAKLTENDVLAIRNLHSRYRLPYKMLGEMFMVSRDNIHLVVTRKTWTHI